MIVEVTADIRIITIENNKIKSKISKEKFKLLKHNDDILNIQSGANPIECSNCGASIKVVDGKCSSCGTKINYLQDWILINK